MENTPVNNKWLFEITPERKAFELNLKEIWRYKDLLTLFVRRDIVALYKQTILGPIWFVVQPILTSIIQFVIFGKIANIPSDGVPYFLFVLAGNTLWNYFSTSFTATADTFKKNQNIFGKVYFPRAIMPLAVTISNLFKFLIQFVFFIIILFYIKFQGGQVHPNLYVLLTPIIILAMALISMGFGMVITSMTTKYRDFTFLLGFGVGLLMYLTQVVYPTSLVLEKLPDNLEFIIYLNPLTGLFDIFKYAFLGEGILNWWAIAWSGFFAVVIYILGLVVFNRTEKSFMDTI
jgi:lipopolysaccharide transport system permease protein